MDVFECFSVSQHLTPGRIVLGTCSKAVNTQKGITDDPWGGAQQLHKPCSQRLQTSMGSSKDHNTPVRHSSSSGNHGECRKRGYADFPAPWSASRKGSAPMECMLSQQHPLCFQQNRFNHGHCAEVVVRCVQTHTPTWSSPQQLQMALRQHFGVSVLQKQRQPCWFVIIAWVF